MTVFTNKSGITLRVQIWEPILPGLSETYTMELCPGATRILPMSDVYTLLYEDYETVGEYHVNGVDGKRWHSRNPSLRILEQAKKLVIQTC